METKYKFNIKLVKKENDIINNDISYNIIQLSNNKNIGYIDIRPTITPYLYYFGQIGYHIYPEFRGNNYAYKACLLLFELAKKEYNLNEIIITCSPDNIPSLKTLNKLNGELIETIEVPKDHELYYRKEKIKCIFKYDLNKVR